MMKLAKPNTREVKWATRAEAIQITEECRADASDAESAWMRLGRKARNALDRHVPEALGMIAEEWLVSTFSSSIAKIRRARKIEAGLRTLPDVEIKQITEGSAYNLTRLPEKERTAPEWVDKAKALAQPEFRHEVEKHLAKLRGKAEPPEPFIIFRLSLPKGVYEELKRAEGKMADMLQVDIETPKGRITTWESLAALINTTDVQILKQETEGE